MAGPMECSLCTSVNPPDAKFCVGCGEPLQPTCPVCGHNVPPDARFCPNCGHRLLAAPEVDEAPSDLTRYLPATLLAKIEAARSGRAMAGERRLVTALFADVTGSTSAAEQLDPEDWVEVINGAFERMIRPVYRYEGTLATLQGDGVLAFFGAPIAHEDDPERAVLAALEMIDAIAPYSLRIEKKWGFPIRIRVGVNTGLVVVGDVGSDLRLTYTAIGDAINVAARMEQTAAPNTVQVSEDTYRLIAPLFEFEDLGQTTVKGKSAPIQTYRPLRCQVRPGPTRGRGFSSPLVGREAETQVLRDLTDRLSEGRGGICAVIGEAGLGKSRLIAEFSEELEAEGRRGPWWSSKPVYVEGPGPTTMGWAVGRSFSYNSSVPYGVVVDLLSTCLELHPEDTAHVRRSKLTDTVETLLGEDAETHLPYLAQLLGIDLDTEESRAVSHMAAPMLQRRTFSAVTALIEAAALRRPLVVVIEDLHWCDAISLALLEELMAVTERAMLMLLVTMRPDRDRPSWQFHETAAREYVHRYTPVFIEPLEAAASAQMLSQMLGGDFEPDLADALITRAEGNPFYLEELLGSLLDAGSLVEEDGCWRITDAGARIGLSPTVAGLLISRLDSLDEGGKTVAQIASVIGREFRLSEVQYLLDPAIDLEVALADLERRNLLEERARLPERRYAFRHVLLQESAYQSMLKRDRRNLHARIADHLIAEGSDDVSSIARHLTEAEELARAMPYLVEAGDRAARAMSLADAIRFYTQALDAAVEGTDPELIRRAHEGLGNAYTLIPDLTRAASSYQELLEFGKERSEPTVQVTALNRLGFTAAALGGDYELATDYLERARKLAEAHNDDLGLAEYHMNSCMIATGQGDMDRAAAHDAEASASGAAAGSMRFRMQGLIQRAISLASAGRYVEGELALAEATRAAEESGNEVFQAAVRAVASPVYLLRQGRTAEAYEGARSGFAAMKKQGSSWVADAAMVSADIARQLARYEEAITLAHEGVELAQELGQIYLSTPCAAQLSRLHAEVRGDAEEAARWRAVVLELIDRPFGDMFAASIWGHLGWAELRLGHPREAAELFTRSASVSSASTHLERPWSLLGAAEADLLLDDPGTSRGLLSQARHFGERNRTATVAVGVGRVSGLIEVAAGEHAAALEMLRPASEAAASMSLRGELWRILTTMGEAHRGLGQEAEAAEAVAAARRAIESIAADIVDEGLRSEFRRTVATSAGLELSDGRSTGT